MSGSFQGGCAEKLVLAPKTIKGAGNSWHVQIAFTLASKYHSRPRYLGQFGRRRCPDVRASAVLRAWHRRKALLKQTDWRRSWHPTHMQCRHMHARFGWGVEDWSSVKFVFTKSSPKPAPKTINASQDLLLGYQSCRWLMDNITGKNLIKGYKRLTARISYERFNLPRFILTELQCHIMWCRVVEWSLMHPSSWLLQRSLRCSQRWPLPGPQKLNAESDTLNFPTQTGYEQTGQLMCLLKEAVNSTKWHMNALTTMKCWSQKAKAQSHACPVLKIVKRSPSWLGLTQFDCQTVSGWRAHLNHQGAIGITWLE